MSKKAAKTPAVLIGCK